MSRHDILGSLAIYTLYELLTGTYAEKIGWPFPYLDGNSYLHEALANVSRCFYAMTALSQEKNYTMNTITIAGNDLPDFLDFVETELEKDKSAASSKYDGLDYEEESTENPKIFSVEIIGLLLTGTIQVITTMIIEYFKHKLNSGKNSEITLKRENDTVNISSVTFKGLSQEEAEKKLKELIPTTGHKGN